MSKKEKKKKQRRCNGKFCEVQKMKEPFKRSMPYASSTNWYKTAKDINPKELEMGIKVEKEHSDIYDELKKMFGDELPWTLDEFAEKVSKGHLKEFENYYTLLKKMEEDAKKDAKK